MEEVASCTSLHSLPYASPIRCSAISCYKKLLNSKWKFFWGSLSGSRKLIELEKGAVEASGLLGQKNRWQPWLVLVLASEGGGYRAITLWGHLHVDSVQIQSNCGILSWYLRLVCGEGLHLSGVRSVECGSCVKVKEEETQRKNPAGGRAVVFSSQHAKLHLY